MEELTEEVFINRARTFFYEVAGVESGSLDADANLIESGILDSLLLISFLAFIEKLRGSPRSGSVWRRRAQRRSLLSSAS